MLKKRMDIRLTEEEADQLEALCERMKMNKSELIRFWIQQYVSPQSIDTKLLDQSFPLRNLYSSIQRIENLIQQLVVGSPVQLDREASLVTMPEVQQGWDNSGTYEFYDDETYVPPPPIINDSPI